MLFQISNVSLDQETRRVVNVSLLFCAHVNVIHTISYAKTKPITEMKEFRKVKNNRKVLTEFLNIRIVSCYYTKTNIEKQFFLSFSVSVDI